MSLPAPRAMLCDRTREWVALRLDGELSDFETAIMRSHLERCEECVRFAEDVAGITRELRSTPLAVPAAPVELELRPAGRLPLSPRRIQFAAAAALVLAAAAVGSLYGAFNARQPNAQPPLVHAPMGIADDDALLRRLRVADLRPTGPLPIGATKPPLGTNV